jgi:hypothetical protein
MGQFKLNTDKIVEQVEIWNKLQSPVPSIPIFSAIQGNVIPDETKQ